MLDKNIKTYYPYLHFLVRVLIGLLFFIHGGSKLFGWFGGTPVELASLFGAAGIIEFVVGIALLVGFYVRLGALLGAATMLYAFFFHVKGAGSLNPLANGGELALVYFLVFLAILMHGAGKWSLEKKLWGKETF
jgi:putative oxidoreductase